MQKPDLTHNSALFDDSWGCKYRAEQLCHKACQTLALNIKELRAKLGMSQQELARRLHTTQSEISRFESDKNTKISLMTLSRMADAFEGRLQVAISLVTEPDEPLTSGFGGTKRYWVQKQIKPDGKKSYWVMNVGGGPTGDSYKKIELAFSRCFELEGQCVMCFSRLKPKQGQLCYAHCLVRWLEIGNGPNCLGVNENNSN